MSKQLVYGIFINYLNEYDNILEGLHSTLSGAQTALKAMVKINNDDLIALSSYGLDRSSVLWLETREGYKNGEYTELYIKAVEINE